jgi:hypothetical protein
MGSHLDAVVKRKGSDVGVPFWFYYILLPAANVGPVERGWINQAILADGEIPPLNRVHSPL